METPGSERGCFWTQLSVPAALDEAGIRRIVNAFAEAARRALDAGVMQASRRARVFDP